MHLRLIQEQEEENTMKIRWKLNSTHGAKKLPESLTQAKLHPVYTFSESTTLIS